MRTHQVTNDGGRGTPSPVGNGGEGMLVVVWPVMSTLFPRHLTDHCRCGSKQEELDDTRAPAARACIIAGRRRSCEERRRRAEAHRARISVVRPRALCGHRCRDLPHGIRTLLRDSRHLWGLGQKTRLSPRPRRWLPDVELCTLSVGESISLSKPFVTRSRG